MPHTEQLELNLTAAPEVSVTRLPDGEVRLRPGRPKVWGSTRDAARVLGVGDRTVRRLLDEGLISGYVPGKRWWRVDMTSVYDYKNERAVAARKDP